MGVVVVAVRTQRLAQQAGRPLALSPFGVDHSARCGAAVGAAAGRVARVASAAGVDATEGGGGQSGKQQRMISHRLRNRLAAGHPGPDQVEHVRGVQPGAGRALRRPTVPAPHMHHAKRLVGAGEARQHLTGLRVDSVGGAAQANRADTVPGPGQRLSPGAEVLRHQSIHHQPRHLR